MVARGSMCPVHIQPMHYFAPSLKSDQGLSLGVFLNHSVFVVVLVVVVHVCF